MGCRGDYLAFEGGSQSSRCRTDVFGRGMDFEVFQRGITFFEVTGWNGMDGFLTEEDDE
jgi:hypothetical protein